MRTSDRFLRIRAVTVNINQERPFQRIICIIADLKDWYNTYVDYMFSGQGQNNFLFNFFFGEFVNKKINKWLLRVIFHTCERVIELKHLLFINNNSREYFPANFPFNRKKHLKLLLNALETLNLYFCHL